MIKKEEAKDKVEDGWFRILLNFEALAIEEKFARESLEDLINQLDKDKEKGMIYKKEFLEPKLVEKPTQNIDKGWSQVCEIEMVVRDFSNLAKVVIGYGPSACEIIEPDKYNLEMSEAQDVLNIIASMMHRFVAAGLGGVLFVKGEEIE